MQKNLTYSEIRQCLREILVRLSKQLNDIAELNLRDPLTDDDVKALNNLLNSQRADEAMYKLDAQGLAEAFDVKELANVETPGEIKKLKLCERCLGGFKRNIDGYCRGLNVQELSWLYEIEEAAEEQTEERNSRPSLLIRFNRPLSADVITLKLETARDVSQHFQSSVNDSWLPLITGYKRGLTEQGWVPVDAKGKPLEGAALEQVKIISQRFWREVQDDVQRAMLGLREVTPTSVEKRKMVLRCLKNVSFVDVEAMVSKGWLPKNYTEKNLVERFIHSPERLTEYGLKIVCYPPKEISVQPKKLRPPGPLNLDPQPRKWTDVLIYADDEKRDGIRVMVDSAQRRQGQFITADTLGFTTEGGMPRKVWNVLLDALESPQQSSDSCFRASIAYTSSAKPATTRKQVQEINRILKAAFGIVSPAFNSTVGKKNLQEGLWLSAFRVKP